MKGIQLAKKGRAWKILIAVSIRLMEAQFNLLKQSYTAISVVRMSLVHLGTRGEIHLHLQQEVDFLGKCPFSHVSKVGSIFAELPMGI